MCASQAIVFDVDGVLVESVEVKTQAFAHLFAHEPPALLQAILAFHLKHGGLSWVEKLKVMYRDILSTQFASRQGARES